LVANLHTPSYLLSRAQLNPSNATKAAIVTITVPLPVTVLAPGTIPVIVTSPLAKPVTYPLNPTVKLSGEALVGSA
jgi:hypothetical protein